jgi:hypothetical protein
MGNLEEGTMAKRKIKDTKSIEWAIQNIENTIACLAIDLKILTDRVRDQYE